MPKTDTAQDLTSMLQTGSGSDDYDGYSRILRTWLVAYGIGGPVFLLSRQDILLA